MKELLFAQKKRIVKNTTENKPSDSILPACRSLVAQICPMLPILVGLCALALSTGAAQASIAYGSINNFDTVNDTGVPCHGFEIELDEIHSADITYTFDWNHYGVPRITEDNTDPLHSKVFVRYASARTNGVWAAYTAVPSGPIAPTSGHQFTIVVNRSLVANFIPSVIPRLEIQSAANAVVLSWAANFAGFRLEQNPTLASTNWTSVTNPVTVVDGQNQALISPLPGNRYFRLAHP